MIVFTYYCSTVLFTPHVLIDISIDKYYLQLILKIMSVRTSEMESLVTQAQQIAQQTTAKDYFLNQQQKLIDDWADKANKLFK